MWLNKDMPSYTVGLRGQEVTLLICVHATVAWIPGPDVWFTAASFEDFTGLLLELGVS